VNKTIVHSTHYTGDHFALSLVFVRFTTYRSTQNIHFVVEIQNSLFEIKDRLNAYHIEYVLISKFRIEYVSAADCIIPSPSWQH